MNGNMSPSAVLVVHNGQTKLVNIKNQDSVTKILDMIPDLVDKFNMKGKKDLIKDEQAKNIAFSGEIEKKD